MAKRYSGTIEMHIRMQADGSYNVRFVELNGEARIESIKGVRLSPFMQARVARDSAKAYDEVALTAIGDAVEDDDTLFMFAGCDLDGELLVRRRRSG